MSGLVIEQIVSADGCLCEADGGMRFAEATTPEGDGTDEAQLRHLAGIRAILLGRRTYEMFAAYWPTADPAVDRAAEPINRIPKFVVSTTLTRAPWGEGEVTVLRPGATGVEGIVRDLTAAHGQVVVWGSIMLTDAILRAGLADRLRLRTAPALVGDGRRLAPEGLARSLLRHVSTEALPSGHVVTEYDIV